MAHGSLLIIDDDEVDRYLLKRLLKKTDFDFDVFEADNGFSALELLNHSGNLVGKENRPSPLIIFLDINMPKMKGPEFLDEFSRIRSTRYSNSCVIMMFSSSETEENRKSALEYDFVKDYLVKGSFNSDDLRQRLESVTAEVGV